MLKNASNVFIVDTEKSKATLSKLGEVAFLGNEIDNIIDDLKGKKIILSFTDYQNALMYKIKLKSKRINVTTKQNYNIKDGENDIPVLESDSLLLHNHFITQAKNTEYIFLKTDFIEEKVYSLIEKNTIVNAPTGTGKSRAYIKMLKIHFKKKAVIVVPTIQLVKEYGEKFEGIATTIHSDKREFTNKLVSQQLTKAFKEEARIIVLTYCTFNKFVENFEHTEDTEIMFDEGHKILENNKTIASLSNGKLFNYKIVSATTNQLEALFDKMKIYKVRLKNSKYNRLINVYDTKEFNLRSYNKKAEFIKEKQKEHKKVVVHYNDKSKANKIKLDLEESGIKVMLYNGDEKNVTIVDEMITGEWDVLLCTSSLTEGVSFRNKVYSIFIVTQQDSADNIPQFLARDRNEFTQGAVICKLMEVTFSKNLLIYKRKKTDWINRTALNLTEPEAIKEHSKNLINKWCSLELLKNILRNSYCDVQKAHNFKEEEEKEGEGKKKKPKKTKEKLVRQRWIDNRYTDTELFKKATKLLKLYNEKDITEEMEVTTQEILFGEMPPSSNEQDVKFRTEFWDKFLSKENRKLLKEKVIKKNRLKFGKSFSRTTDNIKLKQIAKKLEEKKWFLGKKELQKEILYLLDSTLSNKVVKNDIPFLLQSVGYKVDEKIVKGKREYRVVKM
ncbi:MAG: DEAD/DEAH box helicase [Fusobacteriaceae bacterium]